MPGHSHGYASRGMGGSQLSYILGNSMGGLAGTWCDSIELWVVFMVGCSNAGHMRSMAPSVHNNGQHIALILNVQRIIAAVLCRMNIQSCTTAGDAPYLAFRFYTRRQEVSQCTQLRRLPVKGCDRADSLCALPSQY